MFSYTPLRIVNFVFIQNKYSTPTGRIEVNWHSAYISLHILIGISVKYNLFREIFKFRQNMSNFIFREIHYDRLRIVKSVYFGKQITFSNSPASRFYIDISLVCFLQVWFSSEFPNVGLNGSISRKSLVKSPNKNIFEKFE